jgi:hypothetical protein
MTTAVFAAAVLVLAAAPAQSADATADDTARFLAGLPPSSGSPLTALANDPVWQQHARYFDSIFAREDSSTLSKVRAFSREQLADKHDTMLYMFSGPDFLYATSFFPSASTYVLAGLEPAGDVPPLLSLSRPTVDGSLRNLETSMGSLLSYSFFITKNMKVQLHEGPINGTLPVLLVFLARTGKTVQDVSFVSLDEHANVQTDEALATSVSTKRAFHSASHSAAAGVKIVFTDGSGPKQTLYYFSTNLADGSFERSGFRAFLDKLGPADSFIKSASYLLHSGGFNQVRSFLLEHSATVLQDDSGIPVRYFDPRKWRLQAFGHYIGPLALFGRSYQPELTEVFRHAQPLDFGIGYRFRRNESNLLLAQKGAPSTSEQELTPHLPAGQYPDGATAKPKKPRSAASSSQSRKKQADSGTTGALGCRVAGIFPFCSDPQPKSGR